VVRSESELVALADQIARTTMSGLRGERRTRLQELRGTLPVEDQMLLVLRVERELDWNDLVRVMNDGATLDAATLARESARLRKRFQLATDKLRELARERGLLDR
jgi:RNA polymerase sigma-70 factor (ECF subfamily)